nr:MAG TPA: hypothetical protein [Caudoviricetes sp.]
MRRNAQPGANTLCCVTSFFCLLRGETTKIVYFAEP